MRPLGESVWPELVGVRTVVVPVGSTEQHGPHLPLDTDARIAAAVCRLAFAGGTEGSLAGPSIGTEGSLAGPSIGTDGSLAGPSIGTAVDVAPVVAFGASGEHEGFAGTLSIGHAALRAVLVELGRSASRWAHRTLFVNGHGGNLPTIGEVVAQLREEGRDAAWFGCGVAGGDAHAGRTETSIVMALDPTLVRMDAIATGNTTVLQDLLPAMMAGGVAAVSPNGVLGDPDGASPDEGERLLRTLADRLRDATVRWQVGDRGHLL